MQKQEISPILPSEGFVRLPVVVKVLGIGKTTWWVGIKEGRFPQPVKLGPRTTAWRVEDIRALIANPASAAAVAPSAVKGAADGQ